MSHTLITLSYFALTAVAIYAAFKSYIVLTDLQPYEERGERAAKHSERVAHQLYKTRVTEASTTATTALSLLSSLWLFLQTFLDSPTPPASGYVLPPLNMVALYAAFVHNQGFWKAKAKVPFVGGWNEGIEKSKEIRQMFILLGVAWGAVGVLQLVGA